MSTMATGESTFVAVQTYTYENNSDLGAIYNAIVEARKEKSKPTLIRLRTTIGYGSKQQGTHGVHGSRQFLVYILYELD